MVRFCFDPWRTKVTIFEWDASRSPWLTLTNESFKYIVRNHLKTFLGRIFSAVFCCDLPYFSTISNPSAYRALFYAVCATPLLFYAHTSFYPIFELLWGNQTRPQNRDRFRVLPALGVFWMTLELPLAREMIRSSTCFTYPMINSNLMLLLPLPPKKTMVTMYTILLVGIMLPLAKLGINTPAPIWPGVQSFGEESPDRTCDCLQDLYQESWS